ncbi:unnamed protein product [Bursaphelenchus okinawaensis]|uniref:Endonuclease-reverse transcriptase n=1 Tax=Bursaphelenchus okinawaensis TaxID=465554 RepID=A0A811LK49_9BILA|nr:unnamed protein product [Bursaphelenchus okinawaensis]CAG9123973.1 unnamed protein product [Bursaphelenchus okinawaensis]
MKWKLERCQRRMERAMLGLTLRDEVRSRQIRARTKLKDVVEVAITIKWKMAAKIARAGNERLDWKVLNWIPEGKRRVGRPRMRWEDEFVELCGRDWLNRCRRNWMEHCLGYLHWQLARSISRRQRWRHDLILYSLITFIFCQQL